MQCGVLVTSMGAIETTTLRKEFGDVRAVDDLDLTVEQGEVFGFLGHNGAGKSTTINMLLGFLRPTAGDIEVLGHDVTEESRAVRQRTGLLPEGYEPYSNLTGREHVQSAIDAKDADDDPDELLERVGLEPEAARRKAEGYSTGMQQRMSLAVALVGEPDLLIFDEPSSGLDPEGVALLREIIQTETERGATVFFSSHILDEVEKVCDRVGILSHGELVAVDTIDNLRSELQAGATVSATLETVPDDLGLDGIDAVRSVTVEDQVVTAECTDPRAKMRVLRALDDRATVADIGIEDASLEALFDQFTGDEVTAPDETAAEATESPPEQAVAPDGGDR